MQQITSKENALIKHIIKLKEKKYRAEYNEFVIEGAKIVKEAIEENANMKNLIISQDAINSELVQRQLGENLDKQEYILVPNSVFKLLTDVEKPQGVIAVIEKNRQNNQIDFSEEIILILDNIQDPGNLGTIIRTADSVGLTQILVSKGTVDCYNSKVIRSTMGAFFRVNIIESNNLIDTVKQIQNNGFKVVTTSLQTNKSIYDIELKKTAIIVGNEANGVSKELMELSDIKAIIPMKGKTESLNVAVATGVLLYEYVRQNFSLGTVKIE